MVVSDLSPLDHVLTHYTKYLFGTIWRGACRLALDLHNGMPAKERAEFDQFSSVVEAMPLGPGVSRRLDASANALACILATLHVTLEGTAAPENPAAAFAERRLTGVAVANAMHGGGWAWAMLQFRASPETYLARMERLAASSGAAPLGPRPAQSAPDLQWLAYTLEVCERLPDVPRPGVPEYTRMTGEEFGELLDLALRSPLPSTSRYKSLEPLLELAAAVCPAVTDAHLLRMLQARPSEALPANVMRRVTPGGETWQRIAERRPDQLIWLEDEMSMKALKRAMRARQVHRSHTLAAGWSFDDDKQRMSLVWKECYPLVEDGAASAGSSPVQVFTPHKESCPNCKTKLRNLFDLDLTDPRLAFLGRDDDGDPLEEPATRLRIAVCPNCIHIGGDDVLVFTDVDLQGGSKVKGRGLWKREKIKPDGHPVPKPRAMTLGPAASLPEQPVYGDAIGGLPKWEQTAEYPECPDCGLHMRYVGRTGETPAMYGFLCPGCMVAVAANQYD